MFVIWHLPGTCKEPPVATLCSSLSLPSPQVALAPHSRTATQRVLQGSVTDYCCRHARLPVLVVQGVVSGKEREA